MYVFYVLFHNRKLVEILSVTLIWCVNKFKEIEINLK